MPTVLITGGNRGIGLSLCLLFAKMDYKVFMGVKHYVKGLRGLERLVNTNNIEIFVMNVENEDEIRTGSLYLKDKIGILDILINNAAQPDWIPGGTSLSALDIDQEQLINLYKVNVFAPLLIAKHFLPLFKQGSKIINVTSGVGDLDHPNADTNFQVGYATSKAALTLMTKKMAAALKPFGVSVNAIDPGWCKTDMGGPDATFDPIVGAQSIINACLLNTDQFITGQYFKDGHNISLRNI